MKKMVTFVCMLFILFLVYQFAVNYLITESSSEYTITTGNTDYFIKEKFLIEKDNDLYSFVVEDKDNNNSFIYTINKDFNRQRRVISKIENYRSNNLNCIFAEFKNKNIGDIVCNYKQNNVTYSYLKQIGNTEIDNFVNKLKQLGYKSKSWEDKTSKTLKETIEVYNDFPTEFKITIWNYQNLYVIDSNEVKTTELMEKNLYNNKLALLVGKYYVLADNDEDNECDSLLLVNVKDGGKDIIDLDKTIPKDNSYIAGTYQNKLYIIDKTNKVEYEFDGNNKKIKELGNSSTMAKNYDGKGLENVNISYFLNEDKYFPSIINVPELYEKYGSVEVKESNEKYYFKNSQGEIYYVLKNNINTPILLFAFNDIREWKVIGDTVFCISGNIVYMYNDKYGLKPIVEKSDLNYNYKNIYDVYEK